MPSFWPFGRDETSAASFEKSLSALSQKITKTSAQNDGLRQHQRRYKVLWTLYTSFAYILVALILTLVTGWEKWGAVEYSAVAGGPVVIYVVRTGLDAYYNYRISNSQNYLNELNKQREVTIEKLKTATKYNSTQQLLDKYGGGSPGSASKRENEQPAARKRKSEGPQTTPQGGRTGFAPPPTANIPGRAPPPQPKPMTPDATASPQQLEPSEEFAPNAFTAPPPPPPGFRAPPPPSQLQYESGPKWYDRILDVVLGEDETQAKNRIALICSNCKLVNGQAPPGTRTLEEVGRWRCSACQAWNGVEGEDRRILQEVGVGSPTSLVEAAHASAVVDAEVGDEDVEEAEDEEDGAETPAGSTRSKARQRQKT